MRLSFVLVSRGYKRLTEYGKCVLVVVVVGGGGGGGGRE